MTGDEITDSQLGILCATVVQMVAQKLTVEPELDIAEFSGYTLNKLIEAVEYRSMEGIGE